MGLGGNACDAFSEEGKLNSLEGSVPLGQQIALVQASRLALTWQSCYRSEQAFQFLSDLPAKSADKDCVCTHISYDSSLSWRN